MAMSPAADRARSCGCILVQYHALRYYRAWVLLQLQVPSADGASGQGSLLLAVRHGISVGCEMALIKGETMSLPIGFFLVACPEHPGECSLVPVPCCQPEHTAD